MKSAHVCWSVLWGFVGLVFGAFLAVTDSGHVPAVVAPVILGLVGGVSGLVGGLVYGALSRRITPGRIHAVLLGGLCGVVVGSAAYALGLGIPLAYSVFAGAVLGAISVLVQGQRP